MSMQRYIERFVIVAALSVAAVLLLQSLKEGSDAMEASTAEGRLVELCVRLRDEEGEIIAPARVHTGRNFVLCAVARRALGQRAPGSYDRLWPSGDASGELSDPERAYEGVTWRTLGERRFAHLTGYAGPRRSLESPGGNRVQGLGEPLIADLSLARGVLVAFRTRPMRFFSWAQLGIESPAFGPPAVGNEASHPLLRALSID